MCCFAKCEITCIRYDESKGIVGCVVLGSNARSRVLRYGDSKEMPDVLCLVPIFRFCDHVH